MHGLAGGVEKPASVRRSAPTQLGQPIRTKEEVNKLFELHGAKAGTPTMGGVLMLGAVIISSLIWARPDNIAVWLLIFTLLYCGGLGFWDDYLKASKKNSAARPRVRNIRKAMP